jgi:hypothetical protein
MASFSNLLNVYGLLPPDFSLNVVPSAELATPGGNTTYTVSTLAQLGFSGTVSLSVSGLPAGATASFSSSAIGTPGSAILTVTTAATTPIGSSTLTITGTSEGLTHDVTAILTVGTAGATIPQSGWSLLSVDSQETSCGSYGAVKSFDGNPATFWHTQWCPSVAGLPHQIEINLGASYNISGFTYLPRQDGCSHGWISQYQFYVSTDGVNWGNPVASGTFNYGTATKGCPGASVVPAIQVLFPSTNGQYIQLRALSEVSGNPYTSMAEINVLAITNSTPTLSSLTLTPTSVVGGNTSQGTVTLSAAAPSGAVVMLSSSDAAAATVPASVSIASGASSATFTVTTNSVTTSTTSTISASYAGVTDTSMLSVTTVSVLNSFTLTPTSVVGGNTSQGTVTLGAAAPSSAVVMLSSSNTAAATVPVSVSIASGASSATFTVTTSSVATSTASTISASYAGETDTAVLSVQTSGSGTVLNSLALNPTNVVGGSTSQGTVTLSAAAPLSGVVVALSSSNTAAAAVPASVSIAPGASSATFTVTTSSVATSTASTISASYAGVTDTAVLSVQAAGGGTIIRQSGWSLLSVDSQETTCGSDEAVNSFDGNPATFWHTQWCPSVAGLPHQIEINLGASYNISGFTYLPRQDGCSNGWISQYQFYVSTDGVNWGNPVASGTFNYGTATTGCPGASVLPAIQVLFPSTNGQYIQLRALTEVNGNPFTSMAEINVLATTNSTPTLSSLTLNPTSVVGGNTSQGTVTLSAVAASGAVVMLSSSNTAAATVPASVSIASGASSATFTVTTSSVTTSTTSTISASYAGVTVPATLSVTTSAALNSLALNPTKVVGANPSQGTVTLNAAAPSGAVVLLSSSNTAAATVPASVSIAPGASSATFTVTTSSVTSPTTSTISASYAGVTDTAVLTVQEAGSGTVIPQSGWSLLSVDSQETTCGSYGAVNSFDGNPATFWHTQWCPSVAGLPHQIEINLGASYNISGFTYLPRQDGCSNGWISQYQFYVSTDGVNWGNPVASGTFNYGTATTGCPGASVLPAIQVLFPTTKGQYIQLRALTEVNGNSYTSMAELNILQ